MPFGSRGPSEIFERVVFIKMHSPRRPGKTQYKDKAGDCSEHYYLVNTGFGSGFRVQGSGFGSVRRFPFQSTTSESP